MGWGSAQEATALLATLNYFSSRDADSSSESDSGADSVKGRTVRESGMALLERVQSDQVMRSPALLT
jgi:hypothetical protein